MPLESLRINHADLHFVAHLADHFLEPYGQYSQHGHENEEQCVMVTRRSGEQGTHNNNPNSEQLRFRTLSTGDTDESHADFDIELLEDSTQCTITINIILHTVTLKDTSPEAMDFFFFQALCKYLTHCLAADTLLWLRLKHGYALCTTSLITTADCQKLAYATHEALEVMKQLAINKGAVVIELPQ